MAGGLRTVVSLDSFPGLLIPVLQATNPGTFIVKGVLCLVSRSKTVVKRQCLVGVQARTSIAKYY